MYGFYISYELFGFCMQNCIIKFDRLVKARKQVMTSKMYYLTLEAQDGRVYEAKVLVKPWMNFKELQDFKAIDA